MLPFIQQNPVIHKELRGRMHGSRAFILLTIYLAILSCLVTLVYFGFMTSNNAIAGGSVNSRQALGKTIFWTIGGVELLMVCFIAPALTAGAITAERERQTFDLLRITLLSPKALITGKLLTSFSYILLLLLVALPLQSLAYLLGGVAIEEVLLAFLILVITALFYSSLGLFFSSFLKRTLASTVLAYAGAIILVFGIPALILSIVGLGNSLFNNYSSPITNMEFLLLSGFWLLISINPFATAITTEVILLQNQSILYTTIPLTNGRIFYIISPWTSYTLFYLVASLILIRLSIHFVKRVEK